MVNKDYIVLKFCLKLCLDDTEAGQQMAPSHSNLS